jgi:hypothetical protein
VWISKPVWTDVRGKNPLPLPGITFQTGVLTTDWCMTCVEINMLRIDADVGGVTRQIFCLLHIILPPQSVNVVVN